MNPDARPTLLAIRNVSWETPHRILDSCADLEARHACPLEGDPLPPHDEVAGVLVMGGPMNVDETDCCPGLGTTREYLAEAMSREMPVLGICLGAQLLARALGAAVVPGERKEIGFHEVTVDDPTDPILGASPWRPRSRTGTATSSTCPPALTHLAASELTAHQAFRHGNAWGVLFHPEADLALVDQWMATPEMSGEAVETLGSAAAAGIAPEAAALEPALIAATTPTFAALVRNA